MLLGVNANPVQGFLPAEIAESRAKLVRFPLWEDTGFDYEPFIAGCQAREIEPVVVLDRRAFPDDRFAYWMRQHRARHPTVHYWQVGNEADQRGSESSWYRPPSALSRMLRSARRAFGGEAYVIAAGMVSGNPDYLQQVDLSPVSAIAFHPYGQRPTPDFPGADWGMGNVRDLAASYQPFGKPLWVTEFGGEAALFADEQQRAQYHIEMIRALDGLGVEGAIVFCWHDAMFPQGGGMGLLDADGNPKESFAAFRNAA